MRNGSKIRWMLFVLTCCASLLAGLAFPAPVFAAPAAHSDSFPAVIPLPNGWQPEGIAVGNGSTFYAGSRATGAVFRGDLRTGQGEVFVQGQAGRAATGLKFDQRHNLLVVSGAGTGQAYIYDGSSGETLRTYQLSGQPAFINDVVLTKDAAYFTNSNKAELYRVDLSNCSNLPTNFDVIPLSGDWQQVAGFNANGIVASKDGSQLIVVNSTTGKLYRVDPQTGVAREISLSGAPDVKNGDGLLLQGRTLYVVQNQNNQISVVRLNSDWSAGEVVSTLTNPNFDTPTTIARFGDALYAVNGRFNTPPAPDTPYSVVRVELDQ